jgi:hypothetical protein
VRIMAEGAGAELRSPALNCPMQVEMEFRLHPELVWHCPGRAKPVAGDLRFSRSLDEAAAIATVEMV